MGRSRAVVHFNLVSSNQNRKPSTVNSTLAKKLSLLLLAAAAASPAYAITLDFEELPHGDELQGAGNIVSTKGFVLVYAPAANEPYPVGFTTVGPSWQFNTGSASLMANSCSALTTLTAEDYHAFNLASIDLAEANGPGSSGPVIIFEGTTVTGGHVYQTVKLDNLLGFQRLHFSHKFTGVTSVSWLQGDCIQDPPHMFDNIYIKTKH